MTATDVYAVILAGGSGTRFWPKSRHLRPKQLCRIGGQERTMLETTLARLDGFIPPERRLIVTHKDQVPRTQELVQGLAGAILAEPEAKNTAAALALAALEIEQRHGGKGQPVMISLHADHVVKDEAAFLATLERAVGVARQGALTLLGVVPEYPETGFGYIERGESLPGVKGGFTVRSFREKPELPVAQEYVKSGRFYWNAGLFVWRIDVLLAELRKTLPPMVEALSRLAKAHGGFLPCPPAELAAAYRTLPKISIDNAVLEVSRNVAVVETAIGWQDIGTWGALDRAFKADAQGNLVFGDGCLLDTRGTTVDTDGPFVATLGLDDMVVVAAGGAVLVCPKARDQDVKQVVEWLEARGRKELT